MNNRSENNKRQSSRKKPKNNSSDGKENTPKNKKNKTKKRNSTKGSTDGIAVSKQLAMKKQKKQVRNSKSNKMCPNGKPMPSLADLEKMYEDTDTEEQSSLKSEPEISTTPIKDTKKGDEINLLSPSTVNKIAERMMKIIENTKPTELLAQIPLAPDRPPQPVIPLKKRKKSDTPYIVGCKDRPQVPRKASTSFCKGDTDYGVDSNTNESDEDQVPIKRRKKSKIGEYSKSIFNAQSDKIAEKLKANGQVDRISDINQSEHNGFKPYTPANEVIEWLKSTVNDSDESLHSSKTEDYDFNANSTENEVSIHHKVSDIDSNSSHQSNKTEDYDFNSSLKTNYKPVTFSPLPSTSRDNETFIKNDQLFIESFSINNTISETAEKENNKKIIENDNHSNKSLTMKCTIDNITEKQNDTDVQVVETPYETLIVNDEIDKHNLVQKRKLNSSPRIIEPIDRIPQESIDDDDCVILIDDSSLKKKETTYDLTPIIIDDEYSNINIDDSYKPDMDNEIIDIDSLIEENKAIIEKIPETKRYDSVIEVVEIPNSPSPGIQKTEPENTSIYENTRNSSELNNQPNISNHESSAAAQNSEDTVPGENISLDNIPANTPTESRNPIGSIVADFFRTSQLLNASNNVFTRIDNLINTLDCLIPNNTLQTNRQLDENYGSTVGGNSGNSQPYSPPSPSATVNQMTKQNKKKKSSKKSETQVASENLSAGTDSVEKGTRNLGDCPICMDSLSQNAIASTICGHVFCLACIQAAVRSSGKRCPTCRKALKGTGYHQLYL